VLTEKDASDTPIDEGVDEQTQNIKIAKDA
jgi:hypothetical protein